MTSTPTMESPTGQFGGVQPTDLPQIRTQKWTDPHFRWHFDHRPSGQRKSWHDDGQRSYKTIFVLRQETAQEINDNVIDWTLVLSKRTVNKAIFDVSHHDLRVSMQILCVGNYPNVAEKACRKSSMSNIRTESMSAAELKRLEKEERRRQFMASRPDLAGKTKPSKVDRKTGSSDPKPAANPQPKLPTPNDKDGDPKAKPSSSRNSARLDSSEKGNTDVKSKRVDTCRGLFDHLPTYKKFSSSALDMKMGATCSIHPAFLSFCLCLAKQVLTGANSRSVALLDAINQLLDDYECPTEKSFSRDFETTLARHFAFLKSITPMSVAMKNAATAISSAMSKLDPAIPHSQAKREISEFIQKYSDERVVFAVNAIVKLSEDRIKDGDSIMIYSRCHLIEQIIKNSYSKGVVFRVIVVDSSPSFHGQRTLRRLIRECPRLSCSYVLIQSVTFAMKEVTKVFLSATAMMSNGAAQGCVGTAVIAVMAQTYHVPCIMCCESRKFSENAQVNAITRNELCDPEPLLHGKLRDMEKLSILNLAYDITPAHLITMVISEVGCIPATSVPAVTREFLKSM